MANDDKKTKTSAATVDASAAPDPATGRARLHAFVLEHSVIEKLRRQQRAAKK